MSAEVINLSCYKFAPLEGLEELRDRLRAVTKAHGLKGTILLAPEGITRVALVTHGWHLPRAVGVFEHAGLQVIPAPTLVPAPWKTGADLPGWLPDGLAFARSMLAVHEYLGGAWYRLRYGSGA